MYMGEYMHTEVLWKDNMGENKEFGWLQLKSDLILNKYRAPCLNGLI